MKFQVDMNLGGTLFNPLQWSMTISYDLHTSVRSPAIIRNHGFSLGISQVYQGEDEFIGKRKREKEKEIDSRREEAELMPTLYQFSSVGHI